MLKKTKDALIGIMIAVVAAYFYVVLRALLSAPRTNATYITDIFVTYPFFGFLYSFWFVIPIGAVLGVLIPRIARVHSSHRVVFYGTILGVMVGILGSIAVSALLSFLVLDAGIQPNPAWRWSSFWEKFSYHVLLMSLYSALWVGVYSYLCMKKSPLKNELR